MKDPKRPTDLNDRISELEIQLADEKVNVKKSISELTDYFTPAKILNRVFDNTVKNKIVRPKIIASVVLLGGGIVAKRLLINKTKSVFRQATLSLVTFLLAKVVQKKLSNKADQTLHPGRGTSVQLKF